MKDRRGKDKKYAAKTKMLRYPKGCMIDKILEDNKDNPLPQWAIIEETIKQRSSEHEDLADIYFKDFVSRMAVLYPQDKELYLAMWKMQYCIIHKEPLPEAYINTMQGLLAKAIDKAKTKPTSREEFFKQWESQVKTKKETEKKDEQSQKEG